MRTTAVLFMVAGIAGAQPIVRLDPSFAQLVSPSAKIEKLGGGMMFTEGPVWIKDHLLFTDIPANAIRKWTPAGMSVFRQPVFPGKFEQGQFVGANGLTLDSQGRLVSCEHANRRVARTEVNGSITVLADRYEGKRLNSPNDGVYHANGDFYFTDPPYGFAKEDQDPAKELRFNGVYRLRPNGKVELLTRELTRPNGIAFSGDRKKMWISNSDGARKIWMIYDVAANGTLANGRVFHDVTKETAEGAPDGLKVDTKGNLWATGPGGIWVFSAAGKVLGKIQPAEVPANCTFGGADGKTLYMTARTGLYRIRTNVEGIRP